MAAIKQNETEIRTQLTEINSDLSDDAKWQWQGDTLKKRFEFANFVEAFGWMTKVAIHAEKLNHHPEWFNVWNRVDVTLTTHDLNAISDLDFSLLKRMEALLK